jgi:hypothetical protein
MELIKIATYLVGIAQYIVILPILVGIYFFSFLTKELKVLLGGLTVILLMDIILHFFPTAKNTFLYGFTAIDIITFVWMFWTVLHTPREKKMTILLGGLLLIFIGVDAFIWSGLESNGYSNAVSKIFISGLSIYYLIQLIQDLSIVKLSDESLFWVSIGLITSNLIGFIDIFNKPMLTYSRSLYLQFYMIWSIAAIFMYGCFAYTFWKSKHNNQG